MTIKNNFPSSNPTLFFDFANSKTIDPLLTFTRDSIGTYVDKNGIIQEADQWMPRFDHDPVTRKPKGLLFEDDSTNLQTRSSEFNDAAWSINSGAVSANVAVAPDGTTTGDKLYKTADTSLFITQNNSLTSGVTYTQSIFAKKNAVPVDSDAFYVIQIAPSTGFPSAYQNFDLSTGTLGNGDISSGSNNGTATIEDYGNGWYRCSVTMPCTTTTTGGRMAIGVVPSPTSARLEASTGYGSVNNDGLYIWGAQFEANEYASSYIPTTTADVTRATETCEIDLTTKDIEVQMPFTLYAEISTEVVQYARRLFGIRKVGDSTDNIRPFINADGSINWYTTSGNLNTDSLNPPYYSPSKEFFKIAGSVGNTLVGNNRVKLCCNGSRVNTTSTSYDDTKLIRLTIGDSNQGDTPRHWCGHFKTVALYSYELTDEQMTNLTKINN